MPGIFIHSTNAYQALTVRQCCSRCQDAVGNQRDKSSCPHGAYILGEGTDRQTNNKQEECHRVGRAANRESEGDGHERF